MKLNNFFSKVESVVRVMLLAYVIGILVVAMAYSIINTILGKGIGGSYGGRGNFYMGDGY